MSIQSALHKINQYNYTCTKHNIHAMHFDVSATFLSNSRRFYEGRIEIQYPSKKGYKY